LGSEEIQSESNEGINEKLEKNEIQKSDIIEKSTSGSEEIQSESDEGINEELKKNEVQNFNKKEDGLLKDSPNASKDKNKLDKSHGKVQSKVIPVHHQDKEKKIIGKSKPVEIQEIPEKNN
jgi:preprotein translocase subunit SecF